jgi:hypothetical protein
MAIPPSRANAILISSLVLICITDLGFYLLLAPVLGGVLTQDKAR